MPAEQRSIGVILARGGSKRVPRKNIMPICGKPLIAYTILAARAAKSLSRVIVSTDDAAIADISAEFGAEVIMRPPELADDTAAMDDAYRHVLDVLSGQGVRPEIVAGMQANVPVRLEGEIDRVVQRLTDNPWATAVATGTMVVERPEWMKKFRDRARMEIAPYMPESTAFRKQDLPELAILDGATIALRSSVLRETAGIRKAHAYLGDRVIIEIHDRRYATEIDTFDDVALAEFFLSRNA